MSYVVTATHFAGPTDIYVFEDQEMAEAASKNLLFCGAESAPVVEAQPFAADDAKRFIIEAVSAGKTTCYGTFATREEAEAGASTLKQSEDVQTATVVEVTQAEAEAWTIERLPE
jgi:hypothetical protein